MLFNIKRMKITPISNCTFFFIKDRFILILKLKNAIKFMKNIKIIYGFKSERDM